MSEKTQEAGAALIVFGDDPFTILKIAGVLMNFALSFTCFHAIYVNCTLLPRGIRPNWIMVIGGILGGIFFFSMSVLVLVNALS